MNEYICEYCGNEFKHTGYYKSEVRCPKCNDSHVKPKKQYEKLDQYADQKKPDAYISLEEEFQRLTKRNKEE